MRGDEKVLATAQKIVMNLTDKDGTRPSEMIREFTRFDPRLAELQGNVRNPKAPIGELDKALDSAEAILRPWIGAMDGPAHLWEGPRGDIDAYLLAVDRVQFVLEVCGAASGGAKIQEKAQAVMKQAMSRLEEEFRHMLDMHSQPLDPNKASEAAAAFAPDAGAMPEPGQADQALVTLALVPDHIGLALRELATRMIKGGHAQSMVSTYRRERKRVVEESLARLGLQPLSVEDMVKMQWEALEARIDGWLQCVGVAIRVVFASERALSDQVICEPQLAETCFAELASGGVTTLFGFSEAVSSSKRSPEKLFRVLEMYEAMRDLQMSFEGVFAGDGCKLLNEEYELALVRLSEAARGIFSEFENAIERDATKTPVPGGAVHGLTRYVVNYLILLYDYRSTLTQLFTSPGGGNFPVPKLLADQQSEGEGEFSDEEGMDEEEEEERPENSALAETNKWKLHVLQTNLEGKSKLYKDGAQGHLFLMNNVHYIASKVKNSDLRGLLGDDWIRQQASTVRHHANMYQRLTWNRLLTCLRDDPTPGREGTIGRAALKERFKQCNAILEEIHQVQAQWAVPEAPLREELRAAITERVLSSYRSFYSRYARVLEAGKHPSKYIKYSPGDVEAMVQDLFKGGKPS